MSSLSTIDPPRPEARPADATGASTSAADSSLASFSSSSVRLLGKELPTKTCPHCARDAAQVDATVRASGRQRNPGLLIGLSVASLLGVLSIVPAFAFLLWFARRHERSVLFEVRLCERCAKALLLWHARARLAYFAAAALPSLGLMAALVYVEATGDPMSLTLLFVGELLCFAVALVAVGWIRRRDRRDLPFVLDFNGRTWLVELPHTWREVLEREAPSRLERS